MAGEWCAAASAMGVDLASFASTAAYGTHFITLEDLRSPVQKIIIHRALLYKTMDSATTVSKSRASFLPYFQTEAEVMFFIRFKTLELLNDFSPYMLILIENQDCSENHKKHKILTAVLFGLAIKQL
jgi:hypothetical protein